MTKTSKEILADEKARRDKNRPMNELLRSRGPRSLTVVDRGHSDPVGKFMSDFIRGAVKESETENLDEAVVTKDINTSLVLALTKMSDEELVGARKSATPTIANYIRNEQVRRKGRE